MELRELIGLEHVHEIHFSIGWRQGVETFIRDPTAINPHRRDAFYLAGGWEAGSAFARYAFDAKPGSK